MKRLHGEYKDMFGTRLTCETHEVDVLIGWIRDLVESGLLISDGNAAYPTPTLTVRRFDWGDPA